MSNSPKKVLMLWGPNYGMLVISFPLTHSDTFVRGCQENGKRFIIPKQIAILRGMVCIESLSWQDGHQSVWCWFVHIKFFKFISSKHLPYFLYNWKVTFNTHVISIRHDTWKWGGQDEFLSPMITSFSSNE